MILIGIGIIFSSVYLFVKMYELFANRWMSANKILIFVGILGVSLLTSQIIPPHTWDLSAHYEEIERMRLATNDYIWNESRYCSYKGITALFYLVSITPWNGTLVFITVLIELLILEDIIKFYREKGMRAQTASICFFLFIALSNIVLAISGIRNVLAVILANYGIWRFQCKKKSILNVILFFLLGLNIHPACGFVLILYLFSYIPILMVAIVLSMIFLPLLMRYSPLFIGSSNPILSSAAGLFELYVGEKASLDMRVTVVSATLIIMSIAVISYRMFILKEEERYLKFALLYSLGTLGMISQGLIYSRMLYGLGNIYVVILATSRGKEIPKIGKQIIYIYKIICIIYFVGMLLFQGYELFLSIR